MNNKVAIGIVAAIIVVVGAYFIFHKTTAPAAFTPTVATTTAPAATTTPPTAVMPPIGVQPATPVAAPAPKKQASVVVLHHFASFDSSSLTSSSPRPVITGMSDAKGVAIVLDDPEGVGIAGSSEIPVIGGHWSFSAPQTLKPGIYTLHLLGGDKEVVAKLTVTAS